jgi:hypothetical protein
MRYQRDEGLFGALIIHESKSDIHERLGPFIDEPAKKTLALLEQLENKHPGGKSDPFCLPDGSDLPIQYDDVTFFMNGKQIAGRVLGGRGNESHSEFYVVPGKNYRFRILGATKSTILIVSIDFHKMHVIATDGYLVNKFETDFLIVHVGERYDFILEAKEGVQPGTKYPINIQTLAVKCNNNSNLAGESFAFVVYTDDSEKRDIPKTITQESNRCTNKSSPCKVLNCPFQIIPDDFSDVGAYMDCYSVESLQLLYPTPTAQIPSSNNVSSQTFLNFVVQWPKALINGVQFDLPDIPLVENKGPKYECKYPVACEAPGEKYCTHVVYLNKGDTTARFILSAITKGQQDLPNLTHPIHMHGHTYFIAKIGYPEYYENGTIKSPNKDLNVPACGPASWRDATPGEILVNSTTVRKDVVIIPAGGYVVFHLITDNPGYWFMHCHIDEHLNRGMAITVGEDPTCASTPPTPLFNETDEFCFDVKTFIRKELEASCPAPTPTPSPSPSSGHYSSISITSLFVQMSLLSTLAIFRLI